MRQVAILVEVDLGGKHGCGTLRYSSARTPLVFDPGNMSTGCLLAWSVGADGKRCK